jgi:hypothetical protein
LDVDVKAVSTTDTCVAVLVITLYGMSASDNTDAPIGGFRAPYSRMTNLGTYSQILTAKKRIGLNKRMEDALAKSIEVVLHQVKH